MQKFTETPNEIIETIEPLSRLNQGANESL